MEINQSIFLIVLCILVFLTNVIVEVLKNAFYVEGEKVLNKIALVTAIILSVLTYLIYITYECIAFNCMHFACSIIIGFVIALVAMTGWDKVIKIFRDSMKGCE